MIDPFRCLISYHYFRDEPMGPLLAKYFGEDTPPEVFADSGAFSALTQGAPIDVRAYGRWLVENKHHFRVYANLDVIGQDEESAAGTWTNQQILEDEFGLSPLPVFHTNEPWSTLDHYMERGYRYIALGGLVGKSRAGIMPWLVECFRRAEGEAVFHGFGLTSWEPLAALPWYSLDSSSWGSGYRYGFLRLYDPDKRRIQQITLKDHRNVYRHAHLIRRYGFDPAALLDPDKSHREQLCHISAMGWREVESYLRQRHGTITIPGDTDAPSGPALYCADGSIQNLSDGAAGLRLYLADTNLNDLATAARAITPTGGTP